MDWQAALDLVVARTGHERYRDLCADDHPDREKWRALVVRLEARRPAQGPASYPTLMRQAANLAGAVGRAVGAAVRGEAVMVPDEVLESRTAICKACEFHDAARDACTRCGCRGLKRAIATERCPLDPPKWDRVATG